MIVSFLYYDQYERSLRAGTVDGVSRQVTNDKRALEFFLTERRSALTFIVRDRSFAELCDLQTLPRIMQHINDTFALGSFADLGLIDASGKQLCYTGPYGLKGRDYHDQEWFYRVGQRGAFVSEVFLGLPSLPPLRHRHQAGARQRLLHPARHDQCRGAGGADCHRRPHA